MIFAPTGSTFLEAGLIETVKNRTRQLDAFLKGGFQDLKDVGVKSDVKRGLFLQKVVFVPTRLCAIRRETRSCLSWLRESPNLAVKSPPIVR